MTKFTMNISKFVSKTKGNIDLVQKKVMFDISKRVIMRTPVDTGRARANWMLGIGAVNTSTTENTDKGAVTQDGNGRSDTINTISDKLLTATVINDKSMFLTNSIDYIIPLEYGYSKQALGGMVRLTVAEFLGIARDAIKFVRRRK